MKPAISLMPRIAVASAFVLAAITVDIKPVSQSGSQSWRPPADALNSQMPFFGTRRFDMHTKRTFMNPQSNRRGSNEELIVSEIGQVGTQFDGFAHQTIGNSMYNCFKVDETATRNGFEKLGIENAGALITRGVLVDLAGLKKVGILPDNYEITARDLEQALDAQKLQ